MVMREIYASMGISVEQQSQAEQQFSNNLPPSVPVPANGVPYQNSTYMVSGQTVANTGFPTPVSSLFGNPIEPPQTARPIAPPPLFISNATTASQSFTNNPPPPFTSTLSDTGRPTIIGSRPVVSPEVFSSLRGVDPTAPMILTSTHVGPPPLSGFMRKK